MLRKTERVCFPHEFNEKPIMLLKHATFGDGDNNNNPGSGDGGSSCSRAFGNKKKFTRIWTVRFPKDARFSPVRLLEKLRAKVASAIRVVSMRRRSSRKVSSSTLVRTRSVSDHTDSHRAKAVEDCIEFLHSSSSRERPSSVSENSV
ncbi:hypothetical protein RJT34_22228 [Clitoria ternatea]|uniref:Josephin-like protein n=1 Tax=Clitoria ternatea TaxID=43366 RepID=A0AAN9IV14_CLITE